VKYITFGRAGPGNDADTGWRKPISISGQGKAAQASYSAGGLVFHAINKATAASVAPSPVIKRFGSVQKTASSQAGDLHSPGDAC
jgi:hypothetical protein